MPKINSVESFIERSVSLIEAYPSTTHVSITYGNNLKKTKKSVQPDDENSRITKNFVSFKTYDPVSGTCYKITVFRIKELSRILTLLGPRGVQVTKTRKQHTSDSVEETTEPAIKKQKVSKESYVVQKNGLASIMSNVEFHQEDDTAVPNTTNEATADAAKDVKDADDTGSTPAKSAGKKNKKKKGKK